MFSMTFAAKLLVSVTAGLARFATFGAAGVTQLVKSVAHRREMHLLSEMDERSLKDIGLVRSDVSGALATSWLRDPTAVLAARACERTSIAADRREQASHQAASAAAMTRKDATLSEAEIACCA